MNTAAWSSTGSAAGIAASQRANPSEAAWKSLMRAGRAVELITIAGAGHQWPGAAPNLVAQRLLHTDPPSTALDATAVIWGFFTAHAR